MVSFSLFGLFRKKVFCLKTYINYHEMEKRRGCSLKCQKDDNLEDLISQMPDMILANIMSLLELREAGRSSVLSHRWRDLWKLTSVLNFDNSEELLLLLDRGSVREPVRSKYVGWVNKVIELHQWPYLDEFRVRLDLNNAFSSSIDEWIKFSIQKGAKKIEIDLFLPSGEYYTLSQECFACFTSPSNKSSLKRLMSLSLTDVNVNGQLIQHLLQNCPLVEYLYIEGSSHLVDLQVVGPSLKLRHLEIHSCYFMKSLELFAPKLLTFDYFRESLSSLRIGDLPLLAKLSLMSSYNSLTDAFVAFSSNFSMLETLRLTYLSWEGDKEIPLLHKLTNPKSLKVVISSHSHKSILWLIKLIESAPALHDFTLESYRQGFESSDDEMLATCKSCPHLSLKHVEWIGFKASKDEILFGEYLLKSAINIETIAIRLYNTQDAAIAKRALEFKSLAPSRVEFVVQ